jgi:UDPglucose 6-dehydrogenase
MRIGVIGTGHVGLPTAAALAHIGHRVVATDADHEKLALLGRGEVPFFEPGLRELVQAGLNAGLLSFAGDSAEVAEDVQAVFICVGTPPKTSGEANLAAMERAAELIADHATGPLVVVEKSTVPAGTAERLIETLHRRQPDGEFAVVSNPEFLREGRAVEDSLRPDRILVGSDSAQGLVAMREIYAPLIDAGGTWVETDLRTAELAKHACNAFLALKISFANALARICELAEADVTAVVHVMGLDPRIGRAFLDAGLGYGGYCFPKDLVAFERLAARLGYEFPLLQEIARINDEAIESVFRKIERALWNLDGKRVALLGLSFKPGTDDVRFAPALVLAKRLVDAGCSVVGSDPQAGANAKAEVPEMESAPDPYAALDGADCAVLCTDWEEFRQLDIARMRDIMRRPILIDGRNLYEPEAMEAEGFTYVPTGRPGVSRTLKH